ncbi:MAG: hypothetical protein KME56_15935 [Candidatus Thiodiazotropha sp. (ex Ctena orbiculata)]|nr:hypothetical protein [Candidatus Thiodiazotropha taylori]MBT2998103.1 hypothetical protein [Candidatus Thiodiazotropha taylori]MBT3002402.1 hypothetical protein [Candidatus Thiodiazotropha taylori]MBV2108008.1 hypothetical protein [Candidatus Thiodiazotropha taylori]MBV2112701.1 hypothetical protein [Candidatus Thiodiazotropha taylori]
MRPSTNKFVLAFLVLSLALFPLRGALAAVAQLSETQPSHVGMEHHMGAGVVEMAADGCHCVETSPGACCGSDACPVNHCASTPFIASSNLVGTSVVVTVDPVILIDQTLLQQTASPPYRPPRI